MVLMDSKDPFLMKNSVAVGTEEFSNSVLDLPCDNGSTTYRRRFKSANRGRSKYREFRKENENAAILNKENLCLIESGYGHIYKSDAIFHSATRENVLRAQSACSTKYSADCRSTLESPFRAKSVADLGWRPGTSRSSVVSSRSRSTSRLSRSSYDKASTVLAESDWSHIPPKDRKIAELLLSRHGSLLELEDQKQHLHGVWEEEKRETELRKANEEMARRKALIRERQMEDLHRKMQKAYMHEVEQNTLQEKENQLLMKAEKWRHLAEQQEQLRMELAAMRKRKNTSRKHSQEVTLLKKNAEDAKLRNLLAQMMEQSMIKAAHKRHILQLQNHWTLHHSNAEEMNRHIKRKAEVDKAFREQLNQLQAILEEKERRQQENYEAVLQRRYATIKEHAIDQQKLHQVNVMQEKLNNSFKEWQQDLIHYHGLVSARAASVVQQQLTTRREDLRKERVAKMMLHDRRMEEILKEERKKVTSLKHSQRLKERRSEAFLQQKEQAILQSRAAACASAQLRSRLHELMEKDSFDKKLQRLKFEARVWRDVM